MLYRFKLDIGRNKRLIKLYHRSDWTKVNTNIDKWSIIIIIIIVVIIIIVIT